MTAEAVAWEQLQQCNAETMCSFHTVEGMNWVNATVIFSTRIMFVTSSCYKKENSGHVMLANLQIFFFSKAKFIQDTNLDIIPSSQLQFTKLGKNRI